jgi:sulfur carrier protein
MNITVTLNGERLELQPASSLAALLERAGIEPNKVATAVNGEFVPRSLRAERELKSDDQVTCFQPITGG